MNEKRRCEHRHHAGEEWLPGIFHGFSIDSDVQDEGIAHFPVAIIEQENGEVILRSVRFMRFVPDQPESEVNQNAALQFSADIQTLMDSDLAPEIYWQDGQAVCYMAEKFYGKDKFEAVRKAVESLKQPAQV